MLDAPKASVVLPVYNAGKYLAPAIESVLQQTFTDFELLLLDDGSTDGSLQVMRQFAEKDSRCRVVSRENRGLVSTLNEGVEMARAQVLFRMDGDDLCMPTRFAKQMAYLDAHPDCVAVGCRVLLMDPEGEPLCPFVNAEDHEAIDLALLQGNGAAITHATVAMRHRAVLEVGGYRSAFKHAEDLDLFLRMAEYGRLANLPEVLYRYRQHPSSIGYKHRAEQVAASRRAVGEAQQRRGLLPSSFQSGENVERQAKMADIYRRWAWWALSAGNVKTTRKYAFKSMQEAPFDLSSWKLAVCAIRGY